MDTMKVGLLFGVLIYLELVLGKERLKIGNFECDRLSMLQDRKVVNTLALNHDSCQPPRDVDCFVSGPKSW